MEALKGTWREGSLAGDPEGYVENALEEGSSTRDLGGGMKGALRMKHLSLKGPRGGSLGAGGGGSFTGDPGRYVKKVSGYGHFSP
jgi:hypothetical protein